MIARIRTILVAFMVVVTGAAAAVTLEQQSANAQDISDTHLNAAKVALSASRATAGFDILLPNMGERVKQQLISRRPDAADQLISIVDEVTIELAARRGDLETEIARSYASIFTEEELLAIAAFYRSEAGQKLIVQTPTITEAMNQASRVWLTGIQRDMNEAVSKKIEEAGLQ
ncbi:MAG: DUF2059 domain-containing protein [Rhizobiaceae bacterium]